ncbi:MAG: dihydrofolate reductase [Butyrivibrio sp.]|nr:dihydrofolate reductase [Butyrivibrio sp.]
MKIILSADENWGIGNKGQLLIRIPSDMKNFRAETMGKVLVYGRKTLETFPGQQPLEGRKNIILSSNPDYTVKNATVVHNMDELEEALADYDTDIVYCIGGAKVYEELLPMTDTCIVTKIDRAFEADRFFTDLDKSDEWELTEESEEQVYFDTTYTFRVYKRK